MRSHSFLHSEFAAFPILIFWIRLFLCLMRDIGPFIHSFIHSFIFHSFIFFIHSFFNSLFHYFILSFILSMLRKRSSCSLSVHGSTWRQSWLPCPVNCIYPRCLLPHSRNSPVSEKSACGRQARAEGTRSLCRGLKESSALMPASTWVLS